MKKRSLAFLFSLLAAAHAVAAPDPTLREILFAAAQVAVAKVDSVEKGKIAFSTTEVIKGKSHGRLVLTPGPKIEKLKPGDQCVLCWEGGSATKGTVDEDYTYGDPEWLCVPVHNKADKQKLKAWALSNK